MKPIQIYKCKDFKEKYYINKGNLFNLPARLLFVGKSQFSGKSSMALNLLCQDDERLYKNDFDNIYIFSNSINTDTKIKNIIKTHQIPSENIYSEYNPDIIEAIYDYTEEEYKNSIENKEKPPHSLIILDDIGDKSKSKGKNNIIDDIYTRGRHINLSIFILIQKYTMASITQRENASGLLIWETSDKQLDCIADEHSIFNKKIFKSMFRKVVESPFSYLVINYSNNKKNRYLNKNFEPVGPCGKVKEPGGCDCP